MLSKGVLRRPVCSVGTSGEWIYKATPGAGGITKNVTGAGDAKGTCAKGRQQDARLGRLKWVKPAVDGVVVPTRVNRSGEKGGKGIGKWWWEEKQLGTEASRGKGQTRLAEKAGRGRLPRAGVGGPGTAWEGDDQGYGRRRDGWGSGRSRAGLGRQTSYLEGFQPVALSRTGVHHDRHRFHQLLAQCVHLIHRHG